MGTDESREAVQARRKASPMSHVSTDRRSRRWILPLLVVLVWLFVGGPLGSFAGQLTSVQENENANFLPQSTESTLVLEEFLEFTGQESIPATVVFERPGGLTEADQQAIEALAQDLAQVDNVDSAGVTPPEYSEDGTAAQIVVPITATDGDEIVATVDEIREVVEEGAPEGVTALVGGQGGILGDFIEAFGAI